MLHVVAWMLSPLSLVEVQQDQSPPISAVVLGKVVKGLPKRNVLAKHGEELSSNHKNR